MSLDRQIHFPLLQPDYTRRSNSNTCPSRHDFIREEC